MCVYVRTKNATVEISLNWKTVIRDNARRMSYLYDKMCHFAVLISLHLRRTDIHFFGKLETKNLLHFLTYFFISIGNHAMASTIRD